MIETWKPIKGYEGLYEISNLGRVYSLGRTIRGIRGGTECDIPYKPKLLKLQKDKANYLRCGLRKEGVVKHYRVHQLVAKNFLEPVSGRTHVLHGVRGSLCNEVSNLRYGTHSENMLDKYRDGTWPNALGDYKAHMIRKYRKHYKLSYGKLGALFDCAPEAARKIVQRVTYGHLV